MKDYYLDTEFLPLFNWRMINEKNDFTYLRKNNEVGTKTNDLKAWNIVLDTYYKEFGISDDYQVLLELKGDLAMVCNDFAISGDMFLQNKIRHLNEQIDELINKPVDGDLNSAINTVSKWQGYRINQKEVMTNEFMYLLRDLKREVQEIKKKQNG